MSGDPGRRLPFEEPTERRPHRSPPAPSSSARDGLRKRDSTETYAARRSPAMAELKNGMVALLLLYQLAVTVYRVLLLHFAAEFRKPH